MVSILEQIREQDENKAAAAAVEETNNPFSFTPPPPPTPTQAAEETNTMNMNSVLNAESSANMLYSTLNFAVSSICKFISPNQPSKRYEPTSEQEKDLKKVYTEYFKNVSWSMSPNHALIISTLTVFGAIALKAFFDLRAEKTRQKKIELEQKKIELERIRERKRAEQRTQAEQLPKMEITHRAEAKTKEQPQKEQPQQAEQLTKPSDTDIKLCDEFINDRRQFDTDKDNRYIFDVGGGRNQLKKAERIYKPSSVVQSLMDGMRDKTQREINKALRAIFKELKDK